MAGLNFQMFLGGEKNKAIHIIVEIQRIFKILINCDNIIPVKKMSKFDFFLVIYYAFIFAQQKMGKHFELLFLNFCVLELF